MKPSRPSPRKLALGALLVLVAFAVVYGVGVNLLLSTGAIARLVSSDPDKVRLTYARASTTWPGAVHVEGLDLRGRDAHLEWELHVDRADAQIAVAELLFRRFHATRIRASGVTFRARFREEPTQVTRDRVARLPPIDGFPAVPLVDVPPDVRTKGGGGRPFTIALDDVDAAGVREVWIDAFRTAGDMHVTGGFTLAPARRLELAPSAVDVREVALTTGADVIVRRVEGRVEARIDPADLGSAKGGELLRYLSSRSLLHGDLGGVGFLKHLVPTLDFQGGEGAFDGELIVDHGVVKSGSRSHAELGPARVGVKGRTIEARTRIDVTTGDDDAGTWGEVDVHLGDVSLREAHGERPVVTIPSLASSARTAVTDLAEPPRDFTYRWNAPHVTVADLRVLGDAIPKDAPFHVVSGTSTGAVRGHGTVHYVDVEAKVDAPSVVALRGARLASRVGIDARVHVDFAERTIDLAGTTIDLGGLAVAGASPSPGWWGKAKLDAATIRVSPPSFTATVTTACRDARPFLDFYAASKDASPAARAAFAILPDATAESLTAGMRGGVKLAVSKGALDLHALDVRGAASSFRGELRKRGNDKEGGLLITAGPASAGLAFEGDHARPVLVDAPKWFDSAVARR